METEAAALRTKKRGTGASQREEPGEIVSPPRQTNLQPRPPATDPDPTSHGEEQPPGAGGEQGEGIDRISPLPDAILGEIISLLPTKDSVRTQTLASRWRRVWLSAPLNLDHTGLPADDEAQIGIISEILAAHRGPGRRLSVPIIHLRRRPAMVDAWLRSSALNNLEELEIEAFETLLFTMEPLPVSAFRFSATLRVVTISQCNVLDGTVEKLHLPQLRQLELYCVFISATSLHSIIASSPVLECLMLNDHFILRSVRINSPSLISIGIMCHGELIIEDAPSLKRLLNLDARYRLRISIISAPKLETLGYPSDRYENSKLAFGTTVIQKLRPVGFTTVVRNIKILAISIHSLRLDTVINLMRFFPCLEKLYIQSRTSRSKNLWRRKHHNLIRCLDIRLKTIVLKNYQGIKSQVNFATFFILNAKMLQVMIFEGVSGSGNDNEMFIAVQHRSLQLEKRASKEAQFLFTTNHRCNHVEDLTHVKHVRDLSTTDPFECRC